MSDWEWPDTAVLPPYEVVTSPDNPAKLLDRASTLVIRCKFANHLDDRPGEPAEPSPPGGWETYFTSAGAGRGAVYDYLNAQLMGTHRYDAVITPWYELEEREADFIADRAADLQRGRLSGAQTCAELAEADFHLPDYDNLVIALNAPSTADNSRGGDFMGGYPFRLTLGGEQRAHGVSVIGSGGFDLNMVLQELLHAYPVGGIALHHGRNAFVPGMPVTGEYGDPYDVMSADLNYRASGPWGQQGANLSGARRELAGWLPESRRLVYVPDDSVRYPALSVELQPLGAAGPGVQLVTIPVGDDALHYYTVEHRAQAGWDRVLPRDGVLIYEVRPDRVAYLMTRRPGARAEWDAQWQAGETWSAPLAWGSRITVSVDRADSSGAAVRLAVA